jgi:hypothetical protein
LANTIESFLSFYSPYKAKSLIDGDQRNNSAWNQRWTVVHKGTKNPLPLEIAKLEADFALESGCKIDPYNESPWRYLVALLKEQLNQNTAVAEPMIREYEQKSASLTQILVDAQRDPEKCVNMAWARVDMLEMAGDEASLEQVRPARCSREILVCMGLVVSQDSFFALIIPPLLYCFYHYFMLGYCSQSEWHKILKQNTTRSGTSIGSCELANCKKSSLKSN